MGKTAFRAYSAETYHVAHGKWETKAPITSFVPLEENGKHYVVGSFACTTTFFSMSRLTRPSYCSGSVVWNFSLACVWPVSSLPVIVTLAIWPESTSEMNSLKLYGTSLRWNRDEKFHTRATRTIMATQKTTLFTVVFNTSSRRA